MIAGVLLGGLVQGAAIVALAYLAARCVPDRNAATRCALWFVALLALLVIPVLAVVSNAGAQLFAALRPSAGAHDVVISLLPVATFAQRAAQSAAPVSQWILSLWLAGVAIQSARLVVSFVRIERIRRRATPLDVYGRRVLVSTEIAIPIAAGLAEPVVIVPRALVETLAPSDLARVVAHERAHIYRKDLIGNLLQRSIEAILFFNPWVYVIGRNIVNEREAACDDIAVRATGTAGEYAECLASLAQRLCTEQAPLLTPSALGPRKSVIARIERLTRNGAPGATALNYYSIGGTIMMLAILTLALQALSPAATASVDAPSTLSPNGSSVVASCTAPYSDATVVSAVAPEIPHSAASFQGFVTVQVSITPSGGVSKAAVAHSSGSGQVDAAVLKAAKASTYSPAHRNCAPVAGAYLFRADFQPHA